MKNPTFSLKKGEYDQGHIALSSFQQIKFDHNGGKNGGHLNYY
jgi:hypothetical protein